MITDKDIMLKAMQRERDELHERIMQVDRIIKRIKEIETIDNTIDIIPTKLAPIVKAKQLPAIAPTQSTNIKIIILNVFDLIGKATKLKDIQLEYEKISGNKYNIRESVRSLYRANRLKMIKEKVVNRGNFWAKSEWIENGQLLDEYKPEGFDLLYKADDLIYQ